jgi:hypothetical protein
MIIAPPRPSMAETKELPRPIRNRVIRNGQSIILNSKADYFIAGHDHFI